MVEFAINNAEHASTGLTPFYINYGHHLRVAALLGLERSMVLGEAGDDNILDESGDSNDAAVAGTIGRESTHEAGSTLMNGVTTRPGARDAARTMRTRATTTAAPERSTETTARGLRARVAARATPSEITTWASRTLINPSQRCRAIEYHEKTDGAGVAAPPPANFDPNPEPHSADTAAVNAFLD
ncbi:hypothetical protein PHMEG_00012902 [Phytophthora megakarya]|uniref:Reverse transcriptase n=1 Tax=Phytophthora megakarya TaxID=4795 RepID=A0A225W7M8_9STRA|nr:hypothetical protein PHMEG_00012902 [Phytophthora megakarya]